MKPRLHYFDMLKGLAIFLVVMGHVLSMCVRGIDRAPLFKFIGEVHMPLFFFISGWFAWSVKDNLPRAPRLGARAKRLLIPMVAVSSLWIYMFPATGVESPFDSTWSGLWSNEWKNGYWFTLVLFEVFAMYAAIFRLFASSKNIVAQLAIAIAAWAVLICLNIFLPAQICAWTSIGLAQTFFPVFMAGVFARRYSDAFGRLCASSWAITAALVLIVMCIRVVAWSWNYPAWLVEPARILLHLSLAVAAIAVVKPWSERAFAPDAPAGTGRLARMWEYIGTRSLAVYLLHYFFLFPLGVCRPALEAMGLAFVPLLVFSAAVAAAVVAVTLLADYIISCSHPLGFLLTGSESPKPVSVK